MGGSTWKYRSVYRGTDLGGVHESIGLFIEGQTWGEYMEV